MKKLSFLTEKKWFYIANIFVVLFSIFAIVQTITAISFCDDLRIEDFSDSGLHLIIPFYLNLFAFGSPFNYANDYYASTSIIVLLLAVILFVFSLLELFGIIKKQYLPHFVIFGSFLVYLLINFVKSLIKRDGNSDILLFFIIPIIVYLFYLIVNYVFRINNSEWLEKDRCFSLGIKARSMSLILSSCFYFTQLFLFMSFMKEYVPYGTPSFTGFMAKYYDLLITPMTKRNPSILFITTIISCLLLIFYIVVYRLNLSDKLKKKTIAEN